MNDQQELEKLRQSIDRLDTALCLILAERFSVTEKVGHYKAAHSLAAIDPSREAYQFTKIATLAQQCDLDPEFAQKVLRLIIDEVVKKHTALMDTTPPVSR